MFVVYDKITGKIKGKYKENKKAIQEAEKLNKNVNAFRFLVCKI